VKPENYSLGLIPIFSLFLSATNKKASISLNEESGKNAPGLFDTAYNENEHGDSRGKGSRNLANLNVEAIQ